LIAPGAAIEMVGATMLPVTIVSAANAAIGTTIAAINASTATKTNNFFISYSFISLFVFRVSHIALLVLLIGPVLSFDFPLASS
jgi:hypothetical protein